MSLNKNLTKDEFFQLLEKRLMEYIPAIIGNRGSHGMYMHMAQSAIHNVQQIKTIDREIDLFGQNLWGYGINSICDGTETHSQHDVEVVKKINELNKHLAEYRFLWLLIFKLSSESLYISIFCIDSCSYRINSNTHTKYNLKDFENARLRTREERVFVDFVLKGLESPIHFQIDPNVYQLSKSKEQLAKYYISRIEELAIEAKSKTEERVEGNTNIDNLNPQIDEIELGLRNLVVETLILAKGKEDFESLLSGEVKQQIRRRITQHIEKHPNKSRDEYKSIKSALQFCDIEHLKKIILKEENWKYFETKFTDKEKVQKYFDQFSEIRHVVKHSREMTELVRFEGKASMAWLHMII